MVINLSILVTLFVVVILAALALWGIRQFIPMDPQLYRFLVFAVIVVVVLFLLASLFPGVLHLSTGLVFLPAFLGH